MSNLTYMLISDFQDIRKNSKSIFRLKGFIDTFKLKQYNLLPTKEKGMILPLNITVRKKIFKKEGDYFHIILFADETPLEIPVAPSLQTWCSK